MSLKELFHRFSIKITLTLTLGCDDGSTDNTLEVIEDFKKNQISQKGGAKPPKIHYIKAENRGISAAKIREFTILKDDGALLGFR